MCRSCCGLFPALHVPSIKSVQSPAHTRNKKTNKQNKQTKQTNRPTKQNTELIKNGSFSKAVDMSLAGNPGRRSTAPSWPPCATATYHRARQPADHVLVGHRHCCGRRHPVGCGLLAAAAPAVKRVPLLCAGTARIFVYFCVFQFALFLFFPTAAPRTRSPCLSDWTPCQSNVLCVHHFCGGSHNTRMHSTHGWSLLSRLPA